MRPRGRGGGGGGFGWGIGGSHSTEACIYMGCIPVVNGGGVGVSGECVAVDVSNLSPLHCHPNSGLQGHPGGELHPAATCPALAAATCDVAVVKQVGLKQLGDWQPDRKGTQSKQAHSERSSRHA